MEDQRYIKIGKIGTAHGVRGEVCVKSFTKPALNIVSYDPLIDQTGCSFFIKNYRHHKEKIIIKFDTIDTREAAESLRGKELYILRDQLDDTEEEEYYYVDLIGVAVFEDSRFNSTKAAGEPIGKVRMLHNFGASDILEVTLKNQDKVFIPFLMTMVPRISVSEGYITVSNEALDLIKEKRQP